MFIKFQEILKRISGSSRDWNSSLTKRDRRSCFEEKDQICYQEGDQSAELSRWRHQRKFLNGRNKSRYLEERDQPICLEFSFLRRNSQDLLWNWGFQDWQADIGSQRCSCIFPNPVCQLPSRLFLVTTVSSKVSQERFGQCSYFSFSSFLFGVSKCLHSSPYKTINTQKCPYFNSS